MSVRDSTRIGEAAAGMSWHRDGYLITPLKDRRAAIQFVSSNTEPGQLIIDANAWAEIKEAIDFPKPPWSNRGMWAGEEA